jgi:uncharacterized protein (TIGR03545 family)/uncharacterized protein (TIGR03546 family)
MIRRIAALLGGRKTGHVAAGFGWGLFLAFLPMGGFFWVFFLILSFFLRHNHVIKLLVMLGFKLILPLAAPLVDALGWALLHLEGLQGFFTALYNMPLVPLTKFNNTMTAGGLAGGFILGILSYMAVCALAPVCRNTLGPKIAASAWYRASADFSLPALIAQLRADEGRKAPVHVIPLGVLILAAAGLVIFFTFFMNPLLERALERGLEYVFEARAEVDRFYLSLLKFELRMDALTVANRDRPMENLFQTGRLELRLNPAAVLRGKIYIEEVRADSLRFGTPRTVSGALPGYASREPDRRRFEAPPLIDLRNFDPQGLLSREFDKLRTPKAYEAAMAAYRESAAKWKEEAAAVKARGEELREAAQPLIGMNINEARSVEALTRIAGDVTVLVNSIQGAVDDAAVLAKNIEADIQTALALEAQARSALADDLNHLKSYLDLGSGSALAALEPSIRELLTDSAEEYIAYGLRALEVLEKLKTLSAAKAGEEKPKRENYVYPGRDVAFPVRAYPRFYMGILASDFTIDEWHWGFDLRGVSSDPDLSGRTTDLSLALEELGDYRRELEFRGSADFRTNPDRRFGAALSGRNFPVRLGSALGGIGIEGFGGSAAFSADASGMGNGALRLDGELALTEARLETALGTLAEAVDEALRAAGAVELGIGYEYNPSGADRFSLSTNIGDLILAALKRMTERYARQAADELEKALRARIAAYAEGTLLSREELDALFAAVRGDRAALDQLKNALAAKRRDFEGRIRGAAEGAVQGAAAEAQRQLEDAAEKLLEGSRPGAPVLPALPGNLPKLPF